jgi:hypothetical protein
MEANGCFGTQSRHADFAGCALLVPVPMEHRVAIKDQGTNRSLSVNASHSGKVVCPVEAKWIFVQDQNLSILFSERRAASETRLS